jgi:hypothetical protein
LARHFSTLLTLPANTVSCYSTRKCLWTASFRTSTHATELKAILKGNWLKSWSYAGNPSGGNTSRFSKLSSFFERSKSKRKRTESYRRCLLRGTVLFEIGVASIMSSPSETEERREIECPGWRAEEDVVPPRAAYYMQQIFVAELL